jgi:cell division protein FtsQ
MKKKLVIALALFILLSTYKSPKSLLFTKINIKEIKIENNLILNDNEIKKELSFLYQTNLFFLKTSSIKKILKKNEYIESIEIKKIYPNKLKIKIFEKKLIAVLFHKKKKFYISEDINLIKFSDLKNYRNLPLVFGDRKNFLELYTNLKKINFPLDSIDKYYFYESKRWDLETNKNIKIKLPVKDYNKSLKSYMNLKQVGNFDKYKIFDYRINNQLILK